ncbi:Outer membrane protein beta-barrel domain-containing protein [Catalinimonas alkaloidigena]|uniref:Outer membrane protein beta-barrel domain-containing protein n=1 Tax=Catalinimonas alkaloidigena TaxID=1075417 RepID=A0A1G8XXA8_9BACT|nr:outer membrane beta-barrel protein [Catalinimonas alkaloidigena]SDJ95131.1 Outer membrane protein beta-barrel domain-containing protein [Catalinimonas alkaloidigena]
MNLKSYVLLALVAFASLPALAQTEQGSVLLGGNASLQFNDPFSITVAPNIGVFVRDNFAIGSALSVSYQESSTSRYTSLGVIPFARLYFGHLPVRPFVMGNVGYSHERSRSKTGPGRQTSTYNRGIANIGAGLAYFLSDQVALETTLLYGSYAIREGSRNARLRLNMGFQIYF